MSGTTSSGLVVLSVAEVLTGIVLSVAEVLTGIGLGVQVVLVHVVLHAKPFSRYAKPST
ncbi:hypothetical protein OG920_31155 [Streptomyces europaeiscabiei]|uniref:hypothetical protein n=1 Tax=Streptomyces europaeiscabiei TaxID=146819 RepID=UPI0029A6FC82|nr:hypothetical protein [Streptomyces europaeiscabiei]MDX3588762.1 hypothetical protein [Streptomyces europaeiscabiei]MDX3636581.1 hypothetical protein [Streptomyces europaeiscabiei]MDX3654666.1 hypothetical protein [Streptomyces europaeiscabiei]WUD35549.1 hypothetical protein OG858_31820 [Streptomyces europaeiscabiei]